MNDMSARETAEDGWRRRLEQLEEKALRRRLKTYPAVAEGDAPVRNGAPRPAAGAGEATINLASNDYLGLAVDERVIAAARQALGRWGVGAGASRLITGHRRPHEQLEEALAAFKGAERALVFSSGYAANVGVLTALAGPRDHLFLDRLNHASLYDGARLTHGQVRIYRHSEPEHLEELLQRAPARGKRFIVTDGVFSMDGELAPLPALVELAERYEALLVVDDAHGTGVVGPGGRGTAAHFGLQDDVPVRIGTLSKALGAQGGFVVGSEALISVLVNDARAFVYSTGLAPALAAAAQEALRIVRGAPERRRRLQRHLSTLRTGLRERGYDLFGSAPAPLLAVRLGTPAAALEHAERLGEAGITAPAIRPPTVPEGTSRIRLAPRASHSEEAMQRILDAFG